LNGARFFYRRDVKRSPGGRCLQKPRDACFWGAAQQAAILPGAVLHRAFFAFKKAGHRVKNVLKPLLGAFPFFSQGV